MAGIGIVMPGVVSPLVAATLALLLAPDMAPPVAFVIGVIGPLVGADPPVLSMASCYRGSLRRI